MTDFYLNFFTDFFEKIINALTNKTVEETEATTEAAKEENGADTNQEETTVAEAETEKASENSEQGEAMEGQALEGSDTVGFEDINRNTENATEALSNNVSEADEGDTEEETAEENEEGDEEETTEEAEEGDEEETTEEAGEGEGEKETSETKEETPVADESNSEGTTVMSETIEVVENPEAHPVDNKLIVVGIVAVLAILAAVMYFKKKSGAMGASTFESEESDVADVAVGGVNNMGDLKAYTVGKAHNIGKRGSQQDSLGVMPGENRVFGVVADGMGGLENGDKVSQKIVMTMLSTIRSVAFTRDNPLYPIISKANNAVTEMLGERGLYKSGSTIVTAMVEKNFLHWASVGDSRVYLFRNGGMIQLNIEHNYETDLILDAINGKISFSSIRNNPDKAKLTSFIGAGKISKVEGTYKPIPLVKGDRVLLMSDGVYNTLKEKEMADILLSEPDVDKAAKLMEEAVLAADSPRQDNFTVVIIGINN